MTEVNQETGEIVQVADPFERAALLSSVNVDRFDDEQMRGINSWDDAVALLEQEGETIKEIADYLGNGFGILKDKSRLIDTPLIFVEWRINKSKEFGGYFASAAVITKNGEKFIINDGSSGIAHDLARITADTNGQYRGLRVPGGLRESEYDTCVACNMPRSKEETVCGNRLANGTECGNSQDERGRGATYYLNTAATVG